MTPDAGISKALRALKGDRPTGPRLYPYQEMWAKHVGVCPALPANSLQGCFTLFYARGVDITFSSYLSAPTLFTVSFQA